MYRLRPLALLFLAITPGVLIGVSEFGWFGAAIELPRRIIFPNHSDVAMAFQAIEHMRTTPWSDGLLRASTFENGMHISLVDGWPLFAILVRLIDISPDRLLGIVAFLTLPIAGFGGAVIAQALGAHTPRQYAAAAVAATLSAPALFRLEPHLNAAQIWLMLLTAAVSIALRTSAHPKRLIAIGIGTSLLAFLAYPYTGAGSLLFLVGGILDRARRLNGYHRLTMPAGALLATGGAFMVLFYVGGYLDSGLRLQAGGYEKIGLNLIAPFLPVGCGACSPLPALGPAPLYHEFNSMAFMGAGVLLALPIAWIRIRGRLKQRLAEHRALTVLLLIGLLYAIVPAVAIGPIVLYQLTVPADFPGYTLLQALRNSALLAWPLLMVVAVGAVVVATAPTPRRSRATLRLVAVLIVALQVWGYGPLMTSLGRQYTEPVTIRDEILMFDAVVADSSGVRITPVPECRDLGSPIRSIVGLPEIYLEVTGVLGAATGKAAIDFVGARGTRDTAVSRCVVPSVEELATLRKDDWTILYLGPVSGRGPVVLPPGSTGCAAFPGYLICPARAATVETSPWYAAAGLPVDPTFGVPLLPASGLSAPDPRLAAAMAISPGYWMRLFPEDLSGNPLPEWHDIREIENLLPLRGDPGIGLRLAWPATAGTTLVLHYTQDSFAGPLQFEPVDGVVREDKVLRIAGVCETTICWVSTSLGLTSGRMQVSALSFATDRLPDR